MCVSQWGGQKYELKVKQGTLGLQCCVFMGWKSLMISWSKTHNGKKKNHIGSKVKNLGKISPPQYMQIVKNLARYLSLYLPWEKAEQRRVIRTGIALSTLVLLPFTIKIRMNIWQAIGWKNGSSKERWLKSVVTGRSLKWLLNWCSQNPQWRIRAWSQKEGIQLVPSSKNLTPSFSSCWAIVKSAKYENAADA